MRYNLSVCSIWEYGQRKDSTGNPHQEDWIYPTPANLNQDSRLFILCDGMGGHDAGEVASFTVCETMGNFITLNNNDNGNFSQEDFNSALNAAYDALDEKDNGADKKMGTTMCFLKFFNQGAFIAHIGDSRVYHIRPGKNGEDTQIIWQTEDHSLINDLVKVGELTKEEARNSNQKNVITRAMQPHLDPRPKADIHIEEDIKPGDYFFMCSDGMLEQNGMEDGSTLKNIFSETGGDDENKLQILKSVTQNNRDNHSAFIIHVKEVFTDEISESSDEIKYSETPQTVKSRKSSIYPYILIGLLLVSLFVIFNGVSLCSSNNNEEEPVFQEEKIIEPKPTYNPGGASSNSHHNNNSVVSNEVTETSSVQGNNQNVQSTENTTNTQSEVNSNVSEPPTIADDEGVISSDEQKIKDTLNELKKKS